MALDKIYSNTSPNISDSKITLSLLTSKICEVGHSTIVITSVINQSTVVVQSGTVYIQISQKLSLCTLIELCIIAKFMAATV